MLPVRVPGPEEQPPASDNIAGRPVIGPVVPLNATNAEKDGQLLGAAAIQPKWKPTRSPHTCSIAAKPLLHRARARRRLLLAASRYQRDSRYGGASRCSAPKERLPMAAQKMGRRTRTKLRQQSQVRQRLVRHSLHPRPMHRSLTASSRRPRYWCAPTAVAGWPRNFELEIESAT